MKNGTFISYKEVIIMTCIDCFYETQCHAQAENGGLTYCAAHKKAAEEAAVQKIETQELKKSA